MTGPWPESAVRVPERGVRKGDRTRESILDAAVQRASVDGLEGLSIGGLASELGLSKSGLFAHFGSKEELQCATVEKAREIFIEEVVRPALRAPRGLPRLHGLCREWLRYARSGVFRGGCFFASASLEFDGRPGPVRDRIAEIMREWLGALERAVAEARDAGHLAAAADPAQLAFEVNGLMMAANWARQLHGDATAFDRAERAVLERIRGLEAAGSFGTPEA